MRQMLPPWLQPKADTAAIANISRYIGIKPNQLVFIAEY